MGLIKAEDYLSGQCFQQSIVSSFPTKPISRMPPKKTGMKFLTKSALFSVGLLGNNTHYFEVLMAHVLNSTWCDDKCSDPKRDKYLIAHYNTPLNQTLRSGE